ncbi:hypothetical protein IWX49DRAFT_553989 [Phyllosticta citricarpa]
MKAFAVAALAAVALAAPNPDKTVYATDEVTITSCGPEVTNCPARSHSATPIPEVSTGVPPQVTTSAVDGGSAPPASGSPSFSVDVPSYTPVPSASGTPSFSVDIPSYTPAPSASGTPSASVDVPAYTPASSGVGGGVPVGTPYVGTPYGTPGVPVGTPTTPGAGTPGVATPTPMYTGAANAVNAAGAVAGMGALAAFFL